MRIELLGEVKCIEALMQLLGRVVDAVLSLYLARLELLLELVMKRVYTFMSKFFASTIS